jgi:hypothetical protein
MPNPVIVEWKIVGDNSNFTVLGLDKGSCVYYWKEGKWNIL